MTDRIASIGLHLIKQQEVSSLWTWEMFFLNLLKCGISYKAIEQFNFHEKCNYHLQSVEQYQIVVAIEAAVNKILLIYN